MMSLSAALERYLGELGIKASPHQTEQLLGYLALLEKWNRTYNLTAIRDPQKMLVTHLIDSLSIVNYLEGDSLLDVGSGAGLPAIPIAITRPEIRITSLDSNQKKTTFQRHAAIHLKLSNLNVIQARVEELPRDQGFHAITSRAFADLNKFVTVAAHLLAPDGRFYAMKGQFPESEIASLPTMIFVDRVIKIDVPGLDAERNLVVLGVK